MDLKPLSAAQQRNVIETQLGGNLYFDHLIAFSEIRNTHDRIYERQAFPCAASRSREWKRSTSRACEIVGSFPAVSKPIFF